MTRKKIYDIVVKTGLKFLSFCFPSIHMSVPLKPSDRFIEYPFIFKRLPKNKDTKILDVGCSGSFFPLLLASLGYNTTACDIRPYEVLNNLSFDNFSFEQKDIIKDNFTAESFDLVTCISVLEHIGLKGRYGSEANISGDREMVLAIKRILKKEGRALITIPYGKAEIFPPYLRIYNKKGVDELITGFQVLEREFYCLDDNGDWKKCTAEEGQLKRVKQDEYGLALLYLKKL